MNNTPLTALADVIRSKNAGPTQLTIDIFYRNAAAFEQAARSPAMSSEAVAARYRLPAVQVRRHDLPGRLLVAQHGQERGNATHGSSFRGQECLATARDGS